MDLVQKHVTRWSRKPFVWGENDCMLVLADYLQEVTGIDCAAHYRGRYYDTKSCHKLTGLLKSPIAVFKGGIDQLELAPAVIPQRGDVGLIVVDGKTVGGLCLGDKWAAKGVTGLAIGIPDKVLAAWSVANA